MSKLFEKALDDFNRRYYDEASASCAKIISSNPFDHIALNLAGLCAGESGNIDQAISFIERAIKSCRSEHSYYYNLGVYLTQKGDFDNAKINLKESIKLAPDFAEAYHALVNIEKVSASNPIIGRIIKRLKNKSLDIEQRKNFHFALGKIYDDIGEYSRAWVQFEAGNNLHETGYDPVAGQKLTKDIIYWFSKHHKNLRDQQTSKKAQTRKPIFIVGMPRTGSTLIEQILNSYDGVNTGGEMYWLKTFVQYLNNIDKSNKYPISGVVIDTESMGYLGNSYLKKVDQYNLHERVIDKNPLNFFYIGLIDAMFTGAKILHTTRNPLDIALSCYQQNFVNGQNYAFSLENLASFYNDYRRLMEHWKMIYPDMILDVRYEDLVTNTEDVVRQVSDFLELDFDPRSLTRYANNSRVTTASSSQVRQEISSGSIDRWLNYETQMKEFQELLVN